RTYPCLFTTRTPPAPTLFPYTTLSRSPNPPTVLTGTAASVTQTTATLAASVNPNAGNVTECRFEYGTSPSYGASAPCASLPGSSTNQHTFDLQLHAKNASSTHHVNNHA